MKLPNPALNRTGRYVSSTWRVSARARRLAGTLGRRIRHRRLRTLHGSSSKMLNHYNLQGVRDGRIRAL